MLQRLRKHLTYANVIATLALFAALGGGAYAALTLPKNSVRSRTIKNHQVKAHDVARGLLPSGALLGRITSAGSGSEEYTPVGGSPNSDPGGNVLSPNAKLIARDLAIELTTPPGSAKSRTFGLDVNGTLTSVQCKIENSATTCNSGSAKVTIPPRSKIRLDDATTGSPAATDVLFGWRALAP